MQSFVLNPAENPFNVVAPGKRRASPSPDPRAEDGKPFLCFSVQGGDTQDQNLLHVFLNVVGVRMSVQEPAEAANITSYQMRSSFDEHEAEARRLTLNDEMPSWVRRNSPRWATPGLWPEDFGSHHGDLFRPRAWHACGRCSNHGEDYGLLVTAGSGRRTDPKMLPTRPWSAGCILWAALSP